MSTDCNGYIIEDGTISEGAGGWTESQVPEEIGSKTFPPDRVFGGFVQLPRVHLIRYDISPYLNKARRPAVVGRLKKGSVKSNITLHQKRLSQQCVVNVTRENLQELKTAWCKRAEEVSSEPSTDSEDSKSGDMAYNCKICNKSCNSEKKLLNHQRKKHIIYTDHKPMKHVSFSEHVIIHEVTEYHKCRKCPKIFEEYRSLKLHTKQQHKKRKCYICNYCNKDFVDRMFFKVHIKLHCDICGKLFPSKAKCVTHKQNVCRVIKLHKCLTCEYLFYNKMDLKDHSYEHVFKCFLCDVCKDQFQDKCTLAHHISHLHLKKRPTSLFTMRKMGNEKLYLCNFCDVSSVERNTVEIHQQTLPDMKNRAMTGYKDYYFCEHCLKKFPTEQEMLQHKWTHFLNTSDNSNVRPTRTIKKFYNINEKLPLHFQPKVVLTKLIEEKHTKPLELIDDEIDSQSFEISFVDINEINPFNLKKAIVDPKSKKTLISKHQCQTCNKYFSNNYCLNRHISKMHGAFDNLRCKVCEETFVWPSLLRAHLCIRLQHPEMPFDDARPEIHFDNMNNGIDDFNITNNDDYMHSIDFEIPAPIVELTEYEPILNQNIQMNHILQDKNCQLESLGYKLIEVPIEF